MPWWALTLVVAWLALGLVQVLFWQQRGDGVFSFGLHFITGIILVPLSLAVLMFWNIQDRMSLRKAKREPSDIPAVH